MPNKGAEGNQTKSYMYKIMQLFDVNLLQANLKNDLKATNTEQCIYNLL